jgi:hypothetical protein
MSLSQYNYPFNNAEGATGGYGSNPTTPEYIYPGSGVPSSAEPVGFTAPKYSQYNTLAGRETPTVRPKGELTQAGADAVAGGLKAATVGLEAGLTLSATAKAREEAASLAKELLARDVSDSNFRYEQEGVSVANDKQRLQMSGEELDLMSQIAKASANVQRILESRTFTQESSDKVLSHVNENAAYSEYIRQVSQGVK